MSPEFSLPTVTYGMVGSPLGVLDARVGRRARRQEDRARPGQVALPGTKLPEAGIVWLSVSVYRRTHESRRRSSQDLNRDATLSLSVVRGGSRMMQHLVLPLL